MSGAGSEARGEEGVLGWDVEAEAAIGDIRRHVRAACVSPVLPASAHRVYINLTTLEGRAYCVEMSAAGFRVVGARYDDTSLAGCDPRDPCDPSDTCDDAQHNYETPYALLNNISQKYKESFSGELRNKLLHLANNTQR